MGGKRITPELYALTKELVNRKAKAKNFAYREIAQALHISQATVSYIKRSKDFEDYRVIRNKISNVSAPKVIPTVSDEDIASIVRGFDVRLTNLQERICILEEYNEGNRRTLTVIPGQQEGGVTGTEGRPFWRWRS